MASLEERVEAIERILNELAQDTASASRVGPKLGEIDSELSQIKARLQTLEAKN
jgi:hypothetical protein